MKKYIAIAPFKDNKAHGNNSYQPGDDVSHLSEERINRGIEQKVIALAKPEKNADSDDDKAKAKADKEAAKKKADDDAAAAAKIAEDEEAAKNAKK